MVGWVVHVVRSSRGRRVWAARVGRWLRAAMRRSRRAASAGPRAGRRDGDVVVMEKAVLYIGGD